MAGRTILTPNALINSTHTLIKSSEKYFLPTSEVADLPSFVRMAYRRLFRLQPFVSNRKMVRSTYGEYLRYKFKKEDYETKRSIVVGDTPKAPLREEIRNSVIFVIKAVSHLPETKESKLAIARDNTTCRQILKNLLTMEYEKQSLIAKYRPPAKRKDTMTPYQIYRKNFMHMQELNKSAQYRVFGEFDICTIYLNETLDTRL
ncbi:hypothetical protein ZYGR_0AV01470 [Zygosaccharomyces rouxii]|uniref:Increased recombination centers protein 19 n=1 Tax=Zygosaccharomyces rouxii TaxID=4956 RepID=A0A1Q3AIM6_ZYGRO|nr:hypothetical protein ZYGR_0AV01470 [Zygosaccharomyces rouxii]